MLGKLILLPSIISEDSEGHLALVTKDILECNTLFFVENQKVSRRFIKKLYPEVNFETMEIIEIGKHSEKEEWMKGLEKIWMGQDGVVLSDAGCPGVGDPGNQLIKEAHESGVRVVPIAGPNSFIMALMASGLNGQSFSFHGYLPIDKNDRKRKLRQISTDSINTGASQIFMETPYRNQQILEEVLRECQSNLSLCIACDISGKDEFILTLSIQDWKKMNKQLEKIPSVFILGFIS